MICGINQAGDRGAGQRLLPQQHSKSVEVRGIMQQQQQLLLPPPLQRDDGWKDQVAETSGRGGCCFFHYSYNSYSALDAADGLSLAAVGELPEDANSLCDDPDNRDGSFAGVVVTTDDGYQHHCCC